MAYGTAQELKAYKEHVKATARAERKAIADNIA